MLNSVKTFYVCNIGGFFYTNLDANQLQLS